jgi:hypothetical protein
LKAAWESAMAETCHHRLIEVQFAAWTTSPDLLRHCCRETNQKSRPIDRHEYDHAQQAVVSESGTAAEVVSSAAVTAHCAGTVGKLT